MSMKNGTPAQAGCVRRAIEAGGREEFPGVLDAIRATGALEFARRHAEEEVRLAVEAIAPLPVSIFKDSLVELAAFAVARDF
jgi:octaprenyl-diphosphate synthase